MQKTMEAIDYYFKDHKTRFSDNTVRVYNRSLKQFFGFIKKPIDEIKAVDIRSWLNELDESGFSIRTKRIRLISLRLFFRYAFEEGLIKKDPAHKIKIKLTDDSKPYYLNKRQLAELFEASNHSKRDRALIHTLYVTGVRISELLNTRLEDIKWDTRQIWIRKGKGNKERFVLFTAECAERLKEYLKVRNHKSLYLFCNNRGGHLSTEWIQSIFRDYSQKLGFKVTPHMLRHTFGAHLAEKGMKQTHIQDLLGHESLNATRVYTRLTDEARKTKYDSYQI
ncbi:MAG: site-specific tyrosine recombinase/integron integrase [Clostridia bacterium]